MPTIRHTFAAAESPPSVGVNTSFDRLSNVNYLLRRAHQRADDLFAEAMSDLDVTPRQATVLLTIDQNAGISLSELTRVSGVDRGTIAEMVPRMERRGLLVQRKAAEDRRAKSLRLTPSGRALVRDTVGRTEAMVDSVLSTLPHEYHALFVKMLKLLLGLEVESRQPIV